ncbi:glycosyltransferase [alpha proteobacterium U9-1i]|nr:glycosyltransferase [alpha proteobacterium U9-1i]
MRVAYFAHELSDPAVSKRVRLLRLAGCDVELLGFERARFGDALAPQRHVLGRTESGKFLQRILAVIRALPLAHRLRDVWGSTNVIIARNLEMLALVMLLTHVRGDRRRVVYECLDIHRLMIADGPFSDLLRWIERLCLARTSLVLTSSPAFEEKHFRNRQKFAGEVMIVENKVLAFDEPPARIVALPAIPPWRIAWCGVLRCRKSFDILDSVSRQLDGGLIVDLWGVPALDQIPNFQARVDANPHLNFHGRYQPDDLAKIYGGAHFVWAIDYYEAGGNSDWLLPNRLYEGLRFAGVPIALIGTETARWLTSRCLGVTLGEPLAAELFQHLKTLPAWRHAHMREAVTRSDPRDIAFTLPECREIARRLLGVPVAANAA